MVLQIAFPATLLFSKSSALPPGCPPRIHPRKEKMTQQITNSSSINNSARCAHRFSNSKRCRLYVTTLDASYCSIHAQLPQNQQDSPETSAVLTADLKEFRSAIPINEFLARLLLLLAENKISARRAAVLAYITNQLLHTLPAIDHELNPKPGKNEPVEIIFDMPGPDRDREPTPEPTYADVRT